MDLCEPKVNSITCEANTGSLLVSGQQARQRLGHSQAQSGTWRGQCVLGELQRCSRLALNPPAYFTGQSRCLKASSQSADANNDSKLKRNQEKETDQVICAKMHSSGHTSPNNANQFLRQLPPARARLHRRFHCFHPNSPSVNI